MMPLLSTSALTLPFWPPGMLASSRESPLPTILAIGICAIVCGAVYVATRISAARRRDAMRRIADEIGMSF